MRSIVLPLAAVLLLACDSTPKPTPDNSEAKPPAESPTKKAEPTPEPAPLPPAPEGTVTIDRDYVHTCADPQSCPELLQDAGAAHCKALTLGSLAWRLPTIEQLEAWKGNAVLVGFDVFHWSRSTWDEDPAQFWIYDPGSGSKTTAKPDRKPFTIRCVGSP